MQEKYIKYCTYLLLRGRSIVGAQFPHAKCLAAASDVILMETAFASAFLPQQTACSNLELLINNLSIADLKVLIRSEPSWRS